MSVNCDTGTEDEFELKLYFLFEKGEHEHRRYFIDFFNEKSDAEDYINEYLESEYSGDFTKETISEPVSNPDLSVYAFKFTHTEKEYECKEVFYIKETKVKFNHKNHSHPETSCSCEPSEE